MKVLYIGNYKDGTGWSIACINNILAIDAAGIQVVPRAISFGEVSDDIPSRITDLEQNDTVGADICIQHTLPHLYSYNSKYKNIGFYVTETSNFRDSMWHKSINLMDEAWVPNKQIVKASQQTGVTVPIKVVPHSLPVESYKISPTSAQVQELIGTFNFCFIGEFVVRKNIEALIKAFHIEFHPSEPVNLFIKTSQAGMNPNECMDHFNEYIAHIKSGLKLRQNYKDEIIVTGRFKRDDLLSLMGQCHCFVMPSYGEAWCIPALEAMALKIPVIYTKGTGMSDFCSGIGVTSSEVPCYRAVDSLPNLYTANSKWNEIDVEQLAFAMRSMYTKYKEAPKDFEKDRAKAKRAAAKYSHKKVGNIIKRILNDS